MAHFFQEFVKGKLAADNMLKDKKIEIRFVYFVDDVVRTWMESLFKLVYWIQQQFPDGQNSNES